MKKNIIIFGSSGHAQEILECVQNKKKIYNFLGFVEKKSIYNKNKKKFIAMTTISKNYQKIIFLVLWVYLI